VAHYVNSITCSPTPRKFAISPCTEKQLRESTVMSSSGKLKK
jgi:hypothetical protein